MPVAASKPVSVMRPRSVAMVTGLVPSAASCAGVSVVPCTAMLPRPSGAVTKKLPETVSLASPGSTRPRSYTVACPAVSGPLLSPITSVTPSLAPWMVRVSVAVLVSPSLSVIV
ncbi:hypothetical protein D3C71_624460 [compost metagenome]